jgi:uncharacterized protein (TIGR02145 family)
MVPKKSKLVLVAVEADGAVAVMELGKFVNLNHRRTKMNFCNNIPNPTVGARPALPLCNDYFPFNHRRHLMRITKTILALLCLAAAAFANDAVAYHNKGMESFNKKDYDQAISDFTQAIRLNPKFAGSYTVRGLSYQMKGQYYSDIKDYQSALQNYDKALADFQDALRIDPKVPLAETLEKVKISQYAIKSLLDWQSSGGGSNNDAVAYFKRGNAYREKNEYEQAISNYTQAIQLNPNFAEAYFMRGFTYFHKKDYDKAISEYNQAIRLNPNFWAAYGGRGMVYEAKGDYYEFKDYQSAFQSYGKAIEDYETALRIKPNDPTAKEIREKLELVEAAQEAMAWKIKGQPSGGGNAQEKTAPPPASGNTLTDSRDGKKYKTVKIGSQTWMAENLNYEASGSKCYDNNSGNCAKYGCLYNWNTARSACPSGWHLPNEAELDVLMAAVGGQYVAGKKLKAKSGWNENGNGTDEFGFSALPGGFGFSNGSFYNVGILGNWWNASEYSSDNAYYLVYEHNSNYAFWGYNPKSNLFSVRCLKD